MSAVRRPAAAHQTFPELVAESHGRHPIELFAELSAATDPAAQRLCDEATAMPASAQELPQGEGLALPHPLDAEWRFSATTASELLRRALAVTNPGDAILLLSVPTVVLAALHSDADRRFVVISEANVIGAELSTITAVDPRFGPAGPTGCLAAIVDPPWYPAVFAALVGRAAAECQIGAQIFVGAPSLGVRPTSDAERHSTLIAAASTGLLHLETDPEALAYRTPAFEMAAMRAAGLNLALPAWRRGDLLVFQKHQSGVVTALPHAVPAFELTLQGVRLRLIAQPGDGGTAIVAITPDEVFPSVSARSKGRARANLWTSSNRAFVCPPLATLGAMQQLAARHDLWPKGLDAVGSAASDSSPIDPVHLVDDLARIASRDLAHTKALVGGSSWNRAANDARYLNGSAATFRQTLLGTHGLPPS
jgi:hypothetical protein